MSGTKVRMIRSIRMEHTHILDSTSSLQNRLDTVQVRVDHSPFKQSSRSEWNRHVVMKYYKAEI